MTPVNDSKNEDAAQRVSNSSWKVYGLAVVATLATVYLRTLLAPWIGDRPGVILFVLPMVLSAFFGGLGPGLLSAALAGVLSAYFFIAPARSFAFERPADFAQWLILPLSGVLISLLIEELNRTRRKWRNALGRGWHPTTERKVLGGVAFALVCLGLIGGASYLSIRQLREDAAAVQRSHEVMVRLELFLSVTTDAETGQRGYLITGDENHLVPYNHAIEETDADARRLRELTADNHFQQERLGELLTLVFERLAHCGEVIELRRSKGFVAAQREIFSGTGKRLQDQVRTLVAEMKRTEVALLEEWEDRARRSTSVTQAVIIQSSVLACGFTGLALLVLRRDFTGRLRADMALRHSEENLAVTLHSIGDAVLATDTGLKVSRINQVAEQLTGWTSAEAVGRPVGEVFHIIDETTRQPAEIPLGDVLDTGERQGLASHIVLVARDGTERAVSPSAAPIRDRDGRTVGVVLVFRDVSEARAAEVKLAATLEELDQERARLRFIFDALPMGISFCTTQADGQRNRLINDAHLRICGLTREQVEEQGIFERITHPEDRSRQERLKEQLNAGEIDYYSLDKRYVLPNGEIHWVIMSFLRRRFDDGSSEDLSSVVDITERKKAEDELNRFFTLSLDFLGIASVDGYFKRVSPAVKDVLGWTVEEFLARPYLEFVHPDDREATIREVERQVNGGEKTLHFENRYRHLDGSWHTLSWRSAPAPGGLMYAAARDVTALKQTEEEIRKLNAELQQRAAQLEAANTELESFSYSVSHDLRAPLRHVQGYAEMLVRAANGSLSDKARRYLEIITHASDDMARLIDDLLSFSRMSRIDMREGVVDLARLVSEVRAGQELLPSGRNIVWKVGPLPNVLADQAMIRQVFANLLGNALKFTLQREPAVIEVGCQGREEERVVIFVRDNGVGFDMAYYEKLFGVFQRLHRTEDFEGTGIGLANVRRIISRDGGRVWAESRLKEGATFFITLMPVPVEVGQA